MSEEEQFNQAFGEHTGISKDSRERINYIRRSLYQVKDLPLLPSDAGCFTNLSWRLLGRYIANNNHLTNIDLSRCGITDEKMGMLFYELTYSSSLRRLSLSGNSFGMEGLRSTLPFLRNAANLSVLYFYRNINFDSECFELLVQTLNGRSFEGSLELFISDCNINNISALNTYTLSNLRSLGLGGNNIGIDGCITLSNVLQNEGSSLNYLAINRTGIGDEEVELLATSLENNTKLKELYLEDNNITERGYKAFLKLLVDVSSIENTYNSNHTLTSLTFEVRGRRDETIRHINSAMQLNEQHHSSRAAGRAKIIKYQLNSTNRMKLYHLQGIEYSVGSNFADIDATLLPRILALIGREHGQSEFYAALIPMVPYLMSCVDTSGMIKDEMARNSVQAAVLTQQANALIQQASEFSAKNDQLSRRLIIRELGDRRQSTIKEGIGETAAENVKKRQRSEDEE